MKTEKNKNKYTVFGFKVGAENPSLPSGQSSLNNSLDRSVGVSSSYLVKQYSCVPLHRTGVWVRGSFLGFTASSPTFPSGRVQQQSVRAAP